MLQVFDWAYQHLKERVLIPSINEINNTSDKQNGTLSDNFSFTVNENDEIVIETGGNYLYYYNLQCGESSHNCSDYRFVKREASCYDDEFYSHFCQMVDLEQLVADYTKQVRKEVVQEIKNWCDKNFNWVGDGTGYDGQDYNEMIGANNTINKLRKFFSIFVS